jgi:hypothetical protein
MPKQMAHIIMRLLLKDKKGETIPVTDREGP